MKKQTQNVTVQTILHLLGSLILIQGFLLLLPFAIVALYHEYAIVWVFLMPCLLSSLVGKAHLSDNRIDFKDFAFLADNWLEKQLWP